MDKPIITSLLDLDKYKLTMCQFVHDIHPNVHVKYQFQNRTTSIPLAQYIDINELKEHIDHIKTLRFTYEELTYLNSQSEYKPAFINWLATKPYNTNFNLSCDKDRDINLSFDGNWDSAILYETLILSTINELFGRRILNAMTQTAIKDLRANSFNRLQDKLNILNGIPDIKYIEFGTRRRHSQEHQRAVLNTCITKTPNNLLGTSNYLLAKEFGVKPIGTMAHELPMVRSALDMVKIGCYSEPDYIEIDSIPKRDTQKKTIKAWMGYYCLDMRVILTDTFGTATFIEDMKNDKDYADNIHSIRQDSGDPIIFGHKMIDLYNSLGIDPKHKSIVFSDGLDINSILKIYNEFKGKINISFGWGTSLTNDISIKPLSIVIKAAEAKYTHINMLPIPTVKLSDNINKAIGPKHHIKYYKEVFKPEQADIETVY